jgi:hypothetical protein
MPQTDNAEQIQALRGTLGEQLVAVRTAAADALAQGREVDQRVEAVRVEVRASLSDPATIKPVGGFMGVECYTHTYVGGHLADGTPYYVIETVCIEGQMGLGEV